MCRRTPDEPHTLEIVRRISRSLIFIPSCTFFSIKPGNDHWPLSGIRRIHILIGVVKCQAVSGLDSYDISGMRPASESTEIFYIRSFHCTKITGFDICPLCRIIWIGVIESWTLMVVVRTSVTPDRQVRFQPRVSFSCLVQDSGPVICIFRDVSSSLLPSPGG